MRSYDYSHFEVSLTASLGPNDHLMHCDVEPCQLKDVDDLRKAAARLADKAVEQYKIAKRDLDQGERLDQDYEHAKMMANLAEAKPESERSPAQKAAIKKRNDDSYWERRRERYDYQDDWQDRHEEDSE